MQTMTKRSDRIFQSILAQEQNAFGMADAGLALDEQFDISFVSEGAGQLFNTISMDLLNQSIFSLFPPNTRYTYEEHQEQMQKKTDGWIEDLARGRKPVGQPMKGRQDILFKKEDTYPTFRAKVGFYPIFVGYTADEIIEACKTRVNPEMMFSEQVKIYKDFIKQHDCLHTLALFFRVDNKSTDEVKSKLAKEKKRDIIIPQTDDKNAFAQGTGAALGIINAGGRSWKTVIVSLAVLGSIVLGGVAWLYFENIDKIPAAEEKKPETKSSTDPLEFCKLNEFGKFECEKK